MNTETKPAPIKILIADDSASTREYLSHIYNSTPGFQVIGTASNGLEAVEMTLDKLPDVVIMDVHMPIMNGFDATRKIMGTRAVPIIIVSASYDQTEVDSAFQALEAGALMIQENPPGFGHPAHV